MRNAVNNQSASIVQVSAFNKPAGFNRELCSTRGEGGGGEC